MKISKIFAGMSAAAIAMSMLAVSASAADEEKAEPIAKAYIAYGADAWVLDEAKISGTIEIPATGSWWDEKEVQGCSC